MKKQVAIVAIVLSFFAFNQASYASWIWSPDLGKWLNPKQAAKDTPEEQFEWAMMFYNQKSWDRAIEEFERLPAVFPTSRLAAEGVFYSGLCWEEKQDLAKAADAYQNLINHYPSSDRIKDAIKREFEIAGRFAEGAKVKVLGVPTLPGQEKALELYRHIVKNAPFGSYGDEAQFKIGDVFKSQAEFEDAQKAYQTVVDEYPNSSLVTKAKYQIAYCSMQASKKSQYDEQHAERAIEEFQQFKSSFPGDAKAVEADESIRALRASKAMTNFEVGAFYERQKKWGSAKAYYQDVIDKYPETPAGQTAKKKVEEMAKKQSEPAGGSPFRLW